MDDPLPPVEPRFHFAMHKQLLSLRQTIGQVHRRSIPEQSQASASGYQIGEGQLRSTAGIVSFLQRSNVPDEGLSSTDRGIRNFFYLPPVFVTKGQMIKQIFDRFQAEFFYFLSAFGSNPFEQSKRRLQDAKGFADGRSFVCVGYRAVRRALF